MLGNKLRPDLPAIKVCMRLLVLWLEILSTEHCRSLPFYGGFNLNVVIFLRCVHLAPKFESSPNSVDPACSMGKLRGVCARLSVWFEGSAGHDIHDEQCVS